MAGDADAMTLVDVLTVLRDARADRAMITSMGSAREWPRLSTHPLDFHYVPSTMGGAIPLALGLALACPDREFVVLSGDGSLLMNLGTLVTVAASGATNLTIVLLNNGVYEVTGVQATAAACANVDFGRLANDCGIRSVQAFDRIDMWRTEVGAVLALAGPRFVELRVAAVTDDYRLESPGAVGPRLAAFRRALAAPAAPSS